MAENIKFEDDDLHKMHGEYFHESESFNIDGFRFRQSRALYLELTEEAKLMPLKDLRGLLVGAFEIIDGPTFETMPEDQKEVLQVQQYVILRHLLNNISG